MGRAVLGILTTYPDGSSVRGPRWPQWRTFAELIRCGREQGVLVYVFSPDGVDWRRRQVLGWRASAQGPRHWVARWFPMPDVVYNRVPTRTAESRPAVRQCLRRFQRELDGRVFNPHYLNKAMLGRALGHDPELAAHLPATIPLRDPVGLRRFVEEHRRVYLKAVGGSLGNGTMDITPVGGGRWRLRYNPGPGRTRTAYLPSFGALWEAVLRLVRGRPYLAQQAIALARVQGRPFDLRLLVQKQPDGQWRCTGGAARVAGPGQITTHVPRGGRRMAMDAALAAAFGPAAARELAQRAAALAQQAARAMEAALGREFMEMSLDLGIDEQQRLWIFELNSKPLRFDEKDIQRRWVQNLIQYVQALAGSARWAGQGDPGRGRAGTPAGALARRPRPRAVHRPPDPASGPEEAPFRSAGNLLPAAAGAHRPAGAASRPGSRPQFRQ
ncbi:MAG: YheC/YheD family protein [Limnochordales bacterium]|nr:YheC/YheD family protein [Limnochordales bacterium]